MEEMQQFKRKAVAWRERIEAQALSGQKVQDFCRDQGLNYRTFYYWKRKEEAARRKEPRFIAVRPPSAGGSPRIVLPNGVRIELGAGLESEAVRRFFSCLCGVNLQGALDAKP